MKKKLLIEVLAIIMLPMTGCKRETYMKKTEITVDFIDEDKESYTAKAVIKNDLDIDINKHVIKDKKDKKTKVKSLVVGDILEVYYKDESYTKIDHIYVDKVDVDLCYYGEVDSCIPIHYSIDVCSVDMIYYEDAVYIPFSLLYVINEDTTCKFAYKDYSSGKTIYVAHQQKRKQLANYSITALYSYNPRI